MKIAVTGASGFLGSALCATYGSSYDVIGTSRNSLGLVSLAITDAKEVDSFLKSHRPDIVIHTAAMADVTHCQSNQDLAYEVNVNAVRYIADACAKYNSKLIFTSTSSVFDGTKKGTYNEEDEVSPVNFYGETKVLAEQVVSQLDESVTLRFGLIYGVSSAHPHKGWLQKIKEEKVLHLDNKRVRHSIFRSDFPAAITKLFSAKGIYHLAGPDMLTLYQIGKKVSATVGGAEILDLKSNPKVPRPQGVIFDTSKSKRMGIKFSSLEEAIWNEF